jgi:hypothetical protein
MSALVLWIMCAVIVVALAIWMIMVALANRHPAVEKPKIEPRRGRVQGGTHAGGGRSVSPRRDDPVTPGEDPEGGTLPDRAGRPGSGGSPMDL